MGRITIVGLGPAGTECITAETQALLDSDLPVFVRTLRHPAATAVTNATSFDDVYDNAETIESVYETIVEKLVESATTRGHVVYVVPGSPLVAETAVAALRTDERVDVDIRPSMSFLDLVWQRLGIDPLAVSPRLVDGYRFALEAAGERGPLLIGQCDSREVLSDIKLAYEENEPAEAVVLQRLGLPDENVQTVKWEDLDRSFEPDHLTSVWVADVPAPVAAELARVDDVARRLRADCPWDAEQTHDSLKKYAIEEVYELIEAIENVDAAAGEHQGDAADEHLIEELGDVLFQVFAHAAIAQEEGRFNITDIARTVSDKLIQRHPHVYGDTVAETSDDVKLMWEANKMQEKGRSSVMEGIPKQLPALAYAQKVLKRAAGAGSSFDPASVEGKGIGGALLIMVDHAREQGVDAETALRQAAAEFVMSFEDRTR